MKKILVTFLALIAVSAYGQSNAAAIKLGFFTPKAAETGFIIGYEQGRHIDDNLDVAVSIDWFKKDFEDTKSASSDSSQINGLTPSDFETLSETTIYEFPVMVSITAKFPLTPKAKAYATGGFGAEMLYASYHAPDDNGKVKSEKVFAFDWNWRLGGGALYQLGEKSEVFGELVFHYSVPSFDYDVKDANNVNHPMTREYDMYGLLGRVGVRFYY